MTGQGSIGPNTADLIFMLNCYDRWSGPAERAIACQGVGAWADDEGRVES